MTKVFDASGNLVLATGTDVSNIGVVNVGTIGQVDHSGPWMATKATFSDPSFHEWVQGCLDTLAEEHGVSVDELVLDPEHTLTLRTGGDLPPGFTLGRRYMVLDEPRVQDPPHQHYGPIIKGKRGKPRRW